jgi:hypothetical protein
MSISVKHSNIVLKHLSSRDGYSEVEEMNENTPALEGRI